MSCNTTTFISKQHTREVAKFNIRKVLTFLETGKEISFEDKEEEEVVEEAKGLLRGLKGVKIELLSMNAENMVKKKKYKGRYSSVVLGFHCTSKLENVNQLTKENGLLFLEGCDYMGSFNEKDKAKYDEGIKEKIEANGLERLDRQFGVSVCKKIIN